MLSNRLAETRAPYDFMGTTSGVSDTISRAPPRAGGRAAADDDDTLTVNGAAADEILQPLTLDGGPGGPAGRGHARRQPRNPVAEHAAAIVDMPRPGMIPDGTPLSAGVAEAMETATVGALEAATGAPVQRDDNVLLRRSGCGDARGGGGDARGCGGSSGNAAVPASGDGYPASWTRAEVAAHASRDMGLLSRLQVPARCTETHLHSRMLGQRSPVARGPLGKGSHYICCCMAGTASPCGAPAPSCGRTQRVQMRSLSTVLCGAAAVPAAAGGGGLG